MARKPLRSQLNQIRAWVREGRTDAWIAHQLEIPATELREFKRRHGLTADGEEGEVDLRDEIEAEIEAAAREEAEERPQDEDEDEDEAAEGDEGEEDEADAEDGDVDAAAEDSEGDDDEGSDEGARGGRRARRPRDAERGKQGDGQEGTGRPRRRRRRGGRGRGRRGAKPVQASFDHGESDGFGLWLDPAVQENPTYSEHWAGHRAVEVAIEPDRIVIRRAEKSHDRGETSEEPEESED